MVGYRCQRLEFHSTRGSLCNQGVIMPGWALWGLVPFNAAHSHVLRALPEHERASRARFAGLFGVFGWLRKRKVFFINK